ncbi:hypothetical protein X777_05646 [Ooceraea biroi]|uniref:Uncharacterized protein n=1 Tax=Ooceraea biroi TaxID=2015173 RepID=A0A026WFF9_OOCBI|nr:hypothetical protein X777_05646 [Ooceraea biroi]
MDSETKKRRGFLHDTSDTLSWGGQMEVPSSFDESLVRNGRLHWAHRVADVGRERFMRPQELCGT